MREDTSKKIAKGIVAAGSLTFAVSLFILFIMSVRKEFEEDKSVFQNWLYLGTSALTLLGSVVMFSAFYTTWNQWNQARIVTGGLERRGKPKAGTLRDDNFERQLNWLREHKQFVKFVEEIVIALLLLILLLFSLLEMTH
jgi:hypothetical protein